MEIKTILLYLAMILAGIICVFIMGFLISYSDSIHNNNLNEKCTNECSKFNYTFYKIETTSTFNHVNYGCWCIDLNNEPKSLGVIE